MIYNNIITKILISLPNEFLGEIRISQMWEKTIENLTFKLIAEEIWLIKKKDIVYVIAYKKKNNENKYFICRSMDHIIKYYKNKNINEKHKIRCIFKCIFDKRGLYSII